MAPSASSDDSDLFDEFVPVAAYSFDQRQSALQLRQSVSRLGLDDVDIIFKVESRKDKKGVTCKTAEDTDGFVRNTVMQSHRLFSCGVKFPLAARDYKVHDARHSSMVQFARAAIHPALDRSMASVLCLCIEAASMRTPLVVVSFVCESGRHHSLAHAMWMASVFLVMMKPVSVFMREDWPLPTRQKRCACRTCNMQMYARRYHVHDAHRVIGVLAAVAAGDYLTGVSHWNPDSANVVQLKSYVQMLTLRIYLVQQACVQWPTEYETEFQVEPVDAILVFRCSSRSCARGVA